MYDLAMDEIDDLKRELATKERELTELRLLSAESEKMRDKAAMFDWLMTQMRGCVEVDTGGWKTEMSWYFPKPFPGKRPAESIEAAYKEAKK